MSRSWWRVSSGCRTTKATVAADRATCRGPLPDLRQLDQLRAIGDDNKVPRLPVARGRGPPTGVENALKVRPGNRLVGVLAHVATRADGVPGLHVSVVRLHAGQGRRRRPSMPFSSGWMVPACDVPAAPQLGDREVFQIADRICGPGGAMHDQVRQPGQLIFLFGDQSVHRRGRVAQRCPGSLGDPWAKPARSAAPREGYIPADRSAPLGSR